MQAKEDTLLTFPCEFPIKAMGTTTGPFKKEMLQIIEEHFPNVPEGKIQEKLSKNGRYLSLTVQIMATSKAMIDAVYIKLHQNEHVLMTL